MPYKENDPWVICDVSSKKVRMSETRTMYNGWRVYWPYWSPQHPQELVHGIAEDPTVNDPRPRPTDVFLAVGDVTADDL